MRPEKIRYLRLAGERGLGETDPDQIEVTGPTPDELRPGAFQAARTTPLRFVPEFMLKMASPFVWVRPAFGEACEQCGQCLEKCPVGALAMGNDRPQLDKAKCIECFCCHEICPEAAIDLRFSMLGRFVRWTGLMGRSA